MPATPSLLTPASVLATVIKRAIELSSRAGIRRQNRSTMHSFGGSLATSGTVNRREDVALPMHEHQTFIRDQNAYPADGTQAHDPSARSESQEDSLSGCAMGIVIPLGTPVSVVWGQDESLDKAMQCCIQTDNYQFIRHIVLCGWEPQPHHAYQFETTLRRNGCEETWNVSGATLLHFAICSDRLQAAAALLIAFPDSASILCQVTPPGGSPEDAMSWTASDLALLFADLFAQKYPERCATFHRACRVLIQVKEHRDSMPLLSLPTPADRILAAGAGVEAALQELMHLVQPCVIEQNKSS